ncbi:hypothetical protein Dimus_029036, partial [Dionaea muscipula]
MAVRAKMKIFTALGAATPRAHSPGPCHSLQSTARRSPKTRRGSDPVAVREDEEAAMPIAVIRWALSRPAA